MIEWYYSRGGKQQGPVSFEQLREIAASGGLHPVNDLVWTSTMKDWTPSGQVPELMQPSQTASTPTGIPSASPSNPYATPGSAWSLAAPAHPGEALVEIEPGSEPIDIMACVKRGFSLVGRNFGFIVIIGVLYIGISVAAEMALSAMDDALNLAPTQQPTHFGHDRFDYQQEGSALNLFLSQILSIFLSLGLTRIGLNLVSGQAVSVGMLFGGGPKLLRTLGATILYVLMVAVGAVLLIVPGVYLALRFGQFQAAIVDRDLGIMEAFKYSSDITTNNRMNLFGLAVISLLLVLGGCLALVIGVLFALPVVWLSWTVSYRWMQYGHRAIQDQPGTTRPMLANQ